MWSEVEREVNKHPHNTLASLRSKVSEEMADMDREVIIPPYQKFWSRIEAVVDDSGDFIK
jgi:2'-5' RNA ligase